ncbi:MAG: PKD domain-containing protein, partial [Bacteroidota bacterium]
MKKLLALFLVLFCSSRFVGQNILSITANTSTGCAPDSVDISYFDPGAVSYNVTINGYGYYQFLNTTSTTYSFNAPYGGNYSIYVDALDTSNSVIATGSTSINLKGLYAGELNSSISQGICPGDKISFWAGGYYENSVSTSWDMGNGTIYSQLPYSYIDYVYNSTGTYTVTCQASFDGCPSQTISDTIVITNSTLNVPFFEGYIFPNDSVCPNTQVELIGPYQYSLNYDFGDGTFSSSSGVHSYQLTGSYPVSITAINGCGNTYTAFDTIRVVNNASYTEFLSIYVGGISQDSIVCPNTDLYFYANSSVASSYHWDFGNNDTTNLENPTRTFLTTGIKQISLTATNGCGNSKTVTKNIYVTDTIHPGSISVSAIDSICPNQPFYIDVNVPGAPYSDDDNYLYDFGDTSFSVGSSLVYYFTTPGNYNVNITYTNGCGNSVSYNQTIYSGSSAGTQPIVQFQNLGVVCAGDTAVFVSFPSGGSMTYQVDFGDGTPVTGAYSQIYADGELYNIYKHVYTSIGNFNATLTYASQCGGQQSISSPAGASSIAPASAEFFYDETINYCLGDEITFYAFGASSYEWDFGDGTGTLQTTGSLIPVKHRFNQPGIYKVNLVAYSNCGQLDSSYEYVNIPDSKIKIITNQVASNCGLSDGKAIAIASGGTLPYVYEWTNGDNGFIADSIPAGIYSVTVKDKKGCSNYSIATVSDIQGPTILVNNVIDASCNNGNNGVIDISVIGSSAPYSFVWSNGKTTEDINNLVAGPYEVIVTDANGCKATKSIYVEEPDPYYISFTSLLPPCGSNNGALTANILGN